MIENTDQITLIQGGRWRPPSGRTKLGTVAFDQPLPLNVLNIVAKSRSNLLPWRGQFSPQLVESLLGAYAVPDSVVLDPFMGSGTVLVECARLGLDVFGFEVNPAAYILGSVYELCNMAKADRSQLLTGAEAILTRAFPEAFDLPLFSGGHGVGASTKVELLSAIQGAEDPMLRRLLEALVVLVDEDRECEESYMRKWKTIREIVLNLPQTAGVVHANFGDARLLQLSDNSVSFVLSSPPYINVFNYHHNSRSAVESLGWRPLVVARSEIGSNRKFRQNRFLTVVQYCIDMALVLAELRRVCANSARILLILGRESNVHKTPFYNGEILEKLATELTGLCLELKQERLFVNRFGQKIYEDLLHLTPGPTDCLSAETLVGRARDIGQDALMDAVARTPGDRKRYLEDAIARASEVQPSPILDRIRANGAAL